MADYEITVIQDTREKRPLLFPAILKLWGHLYTVKLVKRRLEAGDYCLQGPNNQPLTQPALIERKASVAEIRNNFFTADKHRMKRALDKLCKASHHPILLFEASPSDILKPTKRIPNPGGVIQRLIDECARRRIEELWVGACAFAPKRRAVGELALRFLASYARDSGHL